MSLKPSRRNLNAVPKVKLGELHPLPEPAEEMAIAVEGPPVSAYGERVMTQQCKEAEICTALNMLSSLRLGDSMSGSSTPSLPQDSNFDEEFEFESADDSEQGRSWQFSGDTGSSGFGNSVASFMSWTDDTEMESTRRVQKLVDEFERCIYGEESLDKLNKEAAAECADWRNKFPHFRVTGVGISPSTFELEEVPSASELPVDEIGGRFRAGCDENIHQEVEMEEIIASHGSYQEESLQDIEESKGEILVSESESSRPNTAESTAVYYDQSHAEENLKQKMKDYIMEQLFAYVWTEVSRGLEPLIKLYSERTLQSKSNRPPSAQRPGSRYTTTCASPQFLPAVETARSFTPISELSSVLQVSSKSIHRSVRRTYVCPSLEPNFEHEESSESNFFKNDILRHSAAPPTVRLPQPLSLRSANQVMAPVPSSDLRGYHSAADRRARSMLSWRFNSMSSAQEKFLKPLEEKQMLSLKVESSKSTTTPRQISAPNSPPNWSRHFTLPPIENLDPPSKGPSSSFETKTKTIEVSPRSSTTVKQKDFQNMSLTKEPSMGNTERSPRSVIGAKHKVLSPIHATDTIRIQGTGLSKLELAKQLLEAEEDFLFEKKGITSANGKKDRRRPKVNYHHK